jgi:hypothetical protein
MWNQAGIWRLPNTNHSSLLSSLCKTISANRDSHVTKNLFAGCTESCFILLSLAAKKPALSEIFLKY